MRLKLNPKMACYHGFCILLLAVLISGCKPDPVVETPSGNGYNFFVISDMGSTGRFRQDSVAHTINRLSAILHPKFVINQGDFFHDDGVRDTLDPLWDLQFEKMFTAPDLNVKWYSILGNHEYIGQPQALIDYGKHHPRWTMPERNYSFVLHADSLTSIRFVMIDTSPFAFFYRFDPKYHAVKLQDPAKTVAFADSVLACSKETWKVVVGHHPVYTSDFSQGNTYRLIEQIVPLLRKHQVDFYLSGHIHKFEHTHREGVDYMTTTTGVKPRWTNPWFFVKYVQRSLGFAVCNVTSTEFSFFFINEKGETLYSYRKKKSE